MNHRHKRHFRSSALVSNDTSVPCLRRVHTTSRHSSQHQVDTSSQPVYMLCVKPLRRHRRLCCSQSTRSTRFHNSAATFNISKLYTHWPFV